MQTFRSTVFRKEEKHENEAHGGIFTYEGQKATEMQNLFFFSR